MTPEQEDELLAKAERIALALEAMTALIAALANEAGAVIPVFADMTTALSGTVSGTGAFRVTNVAP